MKKWDFYTTKEIKPEGWLKKQLEIQANGLCGNLDKVWPDVRDSAWIGGKAEGWERVPYWLDGFIPLAYMLDNADFISRVKKYINAILSFQRPSGWICPCKEEDIPSYDSWAVELIAKVLLVYYDCSADERIPGAIYKILKNFYDLLSCGKISLFDWGRSRWFEFFISINFIEERYKEDWVYELSKMVKEQGLDYTQYIDLWKRPLNKWRHETHIVNIAMMLKQEAVSCDILKEEYTDLGERLYTVLEKYNGTPLGLFTGDECLSGLSPIQGTELCAIAEQMYSYEHLFAYSGQNKWAERLEVLAFNALPATISDDMWTHQYVQMSNQIACQRFPGRSLFRTNNEEAHLFGLEPNYGCCTANFNQAWPKFALSAFMHNEDTVISAIPVPSSLTTDSVSVVLKTKYPFENKLEYEIKAKSAFTFKVRVPSFAKNLRVDGIAVSYSEELNFSLCENECRCFEITFDTEPHLIDRPYNLKSVVCGSLVFSLPVKYEKKMIEYEKNGVERRFPYCDYELIPLTEWSYAYSSPFFKIEGREVSEVPFSSEYPPVVCKAQVAKIPWGYEDGFDTVCAKAPESRIPLSDSVEVELYPYGCAKLRMTEIPLI